MKKNELGQENFKLLAMNYNKHYNKKEDKIFDLKAGYQSLKLQIAVCIII
jgi:hypothetical protein